MPMPNENPILAARLSLRMTQTEFAKALGMTQATVSRWEASKLPVSQVVMMAVETLLERRETAA